MKILLAAGIFPPDVGGPATYTKNLAAALLQRGHSVKVLCYSDKAVQDGYPFEVVRILRGHSKVWRYFKYFSSVLFYGRRADILYAQDPVSAGYPTYWASKALNKPFILKITGDYSWEQAMGRGLTDRMIDDFQKLQNFPAEIRKIRRVQLKVVLAAKLVITPSEYLKKLVIGWGLAAEKIQVIHNAISFEDGLENKKEARARLGVNDKIFFALSAGRDVKWKGFDLLKQIGIDLQGKYSNFKLEILHEASHEKLLQNLKAADVFVLNTGYEGFPHIIWEAMMLGTPVITTNVCGNPEIIKDGYSGLLVEYNNKAQLTGAIEKFYGDATLRETFAKNAQEAAKKFTLESMINKTEEVLKLCAS